MCGINGILRLEAERAAPDREELLRTREAMRSRGPDGEGLWLSPAGHVGLGHRRLAIIDLSDAGLQPMARGPGGRYRIVFNGEIYNYRELRAELMAQGVAFETHADTEVILALYERLGPGMLDRVRGMYALALWDETERRLLLARDPYGIKPLYYAERDGYLRFASQVKALEAGGSVDGEVDPVGLAGFLLWGSVPEPYTFRRGVRALPAGHHLVVEVGRSGEVGQVGAPVAHYDFGRPGSVSEDDSSCALDDSVRAHLVADVPVAVFLSAGLDSSLIAALACRAADEPLTTLTLRFDEYRNTPMDEAPLAAEVARALGTRHVERAVSREDFLDLWPGAIEAMDQPSIDGFNTFVVSRAASAEGIKVVLSGLGGDELFGSYHSFRDVPRWSRWARRLGRVPALGAAWPGLAGRLKPDKPKLVGLLRYGATLPGAYFLRRSLFQPDEIAALIGATAAREGLAAYDPLADAGKFLGRATTDAGASRDWQAVHVMESTQYMRNQLLRDSDWASMAHSLELRVPLVDAWLRRRLAARSFEPARSLGKAEAVRRAAPELPADLWSRPKSGFSIPVMSWLDEHTGIDTAPGLASRRLALEVLQAFGVELERADRRNAAIA